jgi:histidinol-phosphatase (PHP family)
MLLKVKPMVVGHFDLVKLFRPQLEYDLKVEEKIKRNIEVIAEYGGLVEINSRSFKKGLKEGYPSLEILKWMKAKGIRFTKSDDSHGPSDVGLYYQELQEWLLEEVEEWFIVSEGQVQRFSEDQRQYK